MTASVKSDLQNILSEKFGKGIFVDSFHSVAGGCINETAKVKTSQMEKILKRF